MQTLLAFFSQYMPMRPFKDGKRQCVLPENVEKSQILTNGRRKEHFGDKKEPQELHKLLRSSKFKMVHPEWKAQGYDTSSKGSDFPCCRFFHRGL